MLSHGNGPQVGLLALQAAAYTEVEAYPLDVLGAQTEGMIGYLIEQELGNLLPAEVPFATILTMIEVDADDPAFDDPTKFVGPIYDDDRGRRAGGREGLGVQARRRRTCAGWCRRRRRSASSRSGRSAGCSSTAWSSSAPVAAASRRCGCRARSARSAGVEAVIDKDLASELLAREVDADLFVMATDVDGVYDDWGTPEQRRLERVTPAELRAMDFAAGSMGPKVDAACRFVEATGERAAIGALADIEQIVDGHSRHDASCRDVQRRRRR